MSSKNLIYALPFKLSEKEAQKAFLENKGFLEKDFFEMKSNKLNIFNNKTIKKKYIPFHAISIQGLKVDFKGDYGKRRQTFRMRM